MRGCLAENSHVFLWKLPGRRAPDDVLLGWMVDRTCDIWKNCKYNLTDSG